MLACASIYLAARTTDYPLPPHPWWKIFGVTLEDIEYVAASILELYAPTSSVSWDYIDSVTKDI